MKRLEKVEELRKRRELLLQEKEPFVTKKKELENVINKKNAEISELSFPLHDHFYFTSRPGVRPRASVRHDLDYVRINFDNDGIPIIEIKIEEFKKIVDWFLGEWDGDIN